MKIQAQTGYSLIEVILAIALFTLISLIASSVFVYGQERVVVAGDRGQAVLLANEGLEVMHNIREADFNSLNDGVYGLSNASGYWDLVTQTEEIGIFQRIISINSVNDDVKEVTVQIIWPKNLRQEAEISVSQYYSNWQEGVVAINTCSDYCLSVDYSLGKCRQKQKQCDKKGGIIETQGNQYCKNDKLCCCEP